MRLRLVPGGQQSRLNSYLQVAPRAAQEINKQEGLCRRFYTDSQPGGRSFEFTLPQLNRGLVPEPRRIRTSHSCRSHSRNHSAYRYSFTSYISVEAQSRLGTKAAMSALRASAVRSLSMCLSSVCGMCPSSSATATGTAAPLLLGALRHFATGNDKRTKEGWKALVQAEGSNLVRAPCLYSMTSHAHTPPN